MSNNPIQRMQLVAPVAVLLKRVKAATAAGKLLAGCTYHPAAKSTVSGVGELPYITPIEYTADEKLFSGQLTAEERVAIAAIGRDVSNLQQTAKLSLILAVDREKGLYDFGNVGTRETRGAMEWIALLRVAIRQGQDGKPDAKLNGTCNQPLMIEVRENGVNELVWSFWLTITFHPQAFPGGTENDLMACPETA